MASSLLYEITSFTRGENFASMNVLPFFLYAKDAINVKKIIAYALNICVTFINN